MREIERRLAPYFERAEPRQRAMASRRGRLSPAERKNTWPLAAISGDATPSAVQHLRRRALWDPEAVRAALRHDIVQHLGDPAAGLVLDETGCLNKGRHSAGVARQDRGTAGTGDTCQRGVFVGDASALGQAVLDRERSLPQEWINDRVRCQQAGLPAAGRLAPKPQLAQQRLARAVAAGVPATWITGDRVYGNDRRLRLWWEAPPRAYGLAVSAQEDVWLGGRHCQVTTIRAALPEDGWTRLRAGDGTKGPRGYDWRWLSLAEPADPAWRRSLLVRRRVSAPSERQADVVFAPQHTTLAEVVRVAGTRWTIASGVEAANSEVGLAQYEVRSWPGWDSASHARHVGVGPPGGATRRRHRGEGVPKKPATSPGTEPSGGVPGQSRSGLPLRVPEMRRLWRLVLAVRQTAHHSLSWSQWRRWHQTVARYYHDKRREALAEAWAA